MLSDLVQLFFSPNPLSPWIFFAWQHLLFSILPNWSKLLKTYRPLFSSFNIKIVRIMSLCFVSNAFVYVLSFWSYAFCEYTGIKYCRKSLTAFEVPRSCWSHIYLTNYSISIFEKKNIYIKYGTQNS